MDPFCQIFHLNMFLNQSCTFYDLKNSMLFYPSWLLTNCLTQPIQFETAKRQVFLNNFITKSNSQLFLVVLILICLPLYRKEFSRQYNFVWDCVEGEKRTIHLRNWYQSQLSWHNNSKSEKPFFSTRTLHQSFFLSSISVLFAFPFFFVLNFLIAG